MIQPTVRAPPPTVPPSLTSSYILSLACWVSLEAVLIFFLHPLSFCFETYLPPSAFLFANHHGPNYHPPTQTAKKVLPAAPSALLWPNLSSADRMSLWNLNQDIPWPAPFPCLPTGHKSKLQSLWTVSIHMVWPLSLRQRRLVPQPQWWTFSAQVTLAVCFP